MRALTIALCLLATPAMADVAGTASVIDGDTIEVHGQRIRLHGIDAPESRHLCRLDGKPWAAAGTNASSPDAPRPEHVPSDFRPCPNYGPTPAMSACLSPKVTGTAGYDPNRNCWA